MSDGTIKILVAIADYNADEHVFNEALYLAKGLAKSKHKLAELLLLHVSPNGAPHSKAVKDALQLRADEALASGVEAKIRHVDFGDPGPVICCHASVDEWGANYIIVGHRGRDSWTELPLGSVSAYVTEHAPKDCAVVVVRPQIKILVAMESREKDEYVFEHAKSLARQLHASMILLHILSAQDEKQWNRGEDGEPIILEGLQLLTRVRCEQGVSTVFEKRLTDTEDSNPVDVEALALLAHEAREDGIPTDFDYRPGSTGEGICEYAHAWNATLIVVGRHQKPSPIEKLLGRVSQYVVEQASCSVMIVHPASDAKVAVATSSG